MFCLIQWWRNVTQSKSSMFAIQIGPKILESFQISIDWKRIKTKSLLVQMRKNLCTGFFTDLSKICNTKVYIKTTMFKRAKTSLIYLFDMKSLSNKLGNDIFSLYFLNPIPTSHGRNQPLYERHVTKSGRNRVKNDELVTLKAKLNKFVSYVHIPCQKNQATIALRSFI